MHVNCLHPHPSTISCQTVKHIHDFTVAYVCVSLSSRTYTHSLTLNIFIAAHLRATTSGLVFPSSFLQVSRICFGLISRTFRPQIFTVTECFTLMYVTKSFAVIALCPQVIYSNITFMNTDFSSKLCFVLSRLDSVSGWCYHANVGSFYDV